MSHELQRPGILRTRFNDPPLQRTDLQATEHGPAASATTTTTAITSASNPYKVEGSP